MPNEKLTIAADWYHLSFDSLYPVIYAHRTIEAARAEVLFSIEHSSVNPSDVVLDLCCGHGRHMAHLIGRCRQVIGVDYSPDLLRPGRAQLNGRAQFVRADMRALPFKGIFDAVVNYFTSFGYFLADEENLKVATGMAQALKPKGRFFIDYINGSYAEENIETKTVRQHREYEIHEQRWIDQQTHRINKTTVVWKDGEKVSETGESVRLYGLTEFTDLLERGGLKVNRVFGDYNGAEYGETQPRMIVLGTRA